MLMMTEMPTKTVAARNAGDKMVPKSSRRPRQISVPSWLKMSRLLSFEFCGICARWDSHCANSWLAFCKNMGTKYVHLLFGPWVLAVKLQEVRQGRCMRSLTFAVLSKSLSEWYMSLALRDCFDKIWSHSAWILYENFVIQLRAKVRPPRDRKELE